jgi:hypothetical protein
MAAGMAEAIGERPRQADPGRPLDGGLIARYFLEPLDGWRSTRILVTFGTPYRGSLNALDFIANGIRKKLGPVTLIELTGLLRSFDSVYQLLPVYPCLDPGDGSLRRITEETGIPGLDRGRAAAALGFHQEIAEAVHAHEREQATSSRPRSR